MKMKKYNANSGWFKESARHSLARRGIRTGRRLTDTGLGLSKINYAKSNYITPISYKDYKCDRCGFVTSESTNHYGKIYNMRCKNCSWQHGSQPFVTMSCMESPPKGVSLLPEWKSTTLGEALKDKKNDPKFMKYMQEHLKKKKGVDYAKTEQERTDDFVELMGGRQRAEQLYRILQQSYPRYCSIDDEYPKQHTKEEVFAQEAKRRGFKKKEISAILSL
jgi:hypothetical protein